MHLFVSITKDRRDLCKAARIQSVFSTLDLRAGYHNIGLDKESQPKTAFVTPFGKYQYNTVPFGLAQAPAYFQELINQVVRKFSAFAIGYLDDIIIFSKNELDHLKHLEAIFQALRQAGLKLKRSKCQFFKSEIQYLGHIVSDTGIRPLPEKLVSVKNMPAPTNATQVKQFLGLAGYYRKFVPRFSDIARCMTALTKKDPITKKDVEFIWTDECEASFNLLKEKLCCNPILHYPDPDLPYTLYTDASKYGWAGVLTQEHTIEVNGIKHTHNHPICYISGLFRGSQLNWAALTKEAYAIYITCHKLSFYLDSADVLLRSDHLPLKSFLLSKTKNDKVNNWGYELGSKYPKMKFQHIAGIKNTLADTLSRLLDFNPDLALDPEAPGEEFGVSSFDILPEIILEDKPTEVLINNITFTNDPDVTEPTPTVQLDTAQLRELQKQDPYCSMQYKIVSKKPKEGKGNACPQFFIDQDKILKKTLIHNGFEYQTTVVPACLIDKLFHTAHTNAGHNGFQRTYAAIRQLFYWKGCKQDILSRCKACYKCQEHNVKPVKFERKSFKASGIPMDFISMDLIGEFRPASSRGNRYALTVTCMLTGFVFCIPIPDKKAQTVEQAYMQNIYPQFGGSRKILTDNGTEFKNYLFEQLAK